MKKVFVFVILSTVVLASLCGLTGCSAAGSVTYANADQYTAGDTEITEKVENIEIDWLTGNVSVVPHSGNTVLVSEKAEAGKTLLTVTENGFGKRTELSEYLRTGPDGEKTAQSRGGKGLKNYNITPKTGFVAGCRVVGDNDDVMLIETGGVIIRIPASSINVYKRDVQGVIVMRIEEGSQVVSLERVEQEEEA